MQSEPIPIVTLCGFLGSGKTTLLRRWRRDETLKEAATIVHDLSEFGLDAELLSDEGSEPVQGHLVGRVACLLYTSPSPRDQRGSRMPSSA